MAAKTDVIPKIFPIKYKPNQDRPRDMEWERKTVRIKVAKKSVKVGKVLLPIKEVNKMLVLEGKGPLFQLGSPSITGDTVQVDVGVDPGYANLLKTDNTPYALEVEVTPFAGVTGALGAALGSTMGPMGAVLGPIAAGAAMQTLPHVRGTTKLAPEFPHPYIWVKDVDGGTVEMVPVDSTLKEGTPVPTKLKSYDPQQDQWVEKPEILTAKAEEGKSAKHFKVVSATAAEVKVATTRLFAGIGEYPKDGSALGSIRLGRAQTMTPPAANQSLPVPLRVKCGAVRLRFRVVPLEKESLAWETPAPLLAPGESFLVRCPNMPKDQTIRGTIEWEIVFDQSDPRVKEDEKFPKGPQLVSVDNLAAGVTLEIHPEAVVPGEPLNLAAELPVVTISVEKLGWQPHTRRLEYTDKTGAFDSILQAVLKQDGALTFDKIVGDYETPRKLFKLESGKNSIEYVKVTVTALGKS